MVVYTRAGDKFVSLNERANFANLSNSDVFISIHCNAATNSNAHGVEVLYFPTSAPGHRLAKIVQGKLATETGLADRGIVGRPHLAVLRLTHMPAVLVECGFISNPTEEALLETEEFQKKCARAIADGILAFLGVQEKTWQKKAQQWVVEKGISDGSRPEDPATREEVWEMMRRLANVQG